MKKIQAYLNMMDILRENKNNSNIDYFLNLADPFAIDDEYSIATLFIKEYDEYFINHIEDDIEIYYFLLSFLDKFNNYEYNLSETFIKTSLSSFIQLQTSTQM